MKINDYDPIKDLDANIQSIREVKEDRIKEKAALKGPTDSDRVDISSKAKAVQRIKEEVDSLPDIRADRVDEARRAIESGTYNIKGEKVADRIIMESVIDSIL